ncbi:UNVERIFIED_CONTAM: hypothetical protein FKN15_041071 [Acipenser sinensis]
MASKSSYKSARGAGLRNTVRFRWKEENKEDFLDRDQFVEKVLLGQLRFVPAQIYCLQCPKRSITYADAVRSEDPAEEEPANQKAGETVPETLQEMEEEKEEEEGVVRPSRRVLASSCDYNGSFPGNQEHWSEVKRGREKRKNIDEPLKSQSEAATKRKVEGIPLSVNPYGALLVREEGEALEELSEEGVIRDWSECSTGSAELGATLEEIQEQVLALGNDSTRQTLSSHEKEGPSECGPGHMPALEGKKGT